MWIRHEVENGASVLYLAPARSTAAAWGELAGKRKIFSATAAAGGFDARGAVKGFNAAIGGILDEMETWIRSN